MTNNRPSFDEQALDLHGVLFNDLDASSRMELMRRSVHMDSLNHFYSQRGQS